MSKNEHEITLPLAPGEGKEPSTHLAISVGYDKGGPNYFLGGTNARGYNLCVQPVRETVEKASAADIARGSKPEITFRSFVLGAGYRHMIEPAARLSAKRLATLAAEHLADARAHKGKAWELIQAVCTQYKLTLAEPLVETAHENLTTAAQ